MNVKFYSIKNLVYIIWNLQFKITSTQNAKKNRAFRGKQRLFFTIMIMNTSKREDQSIFHILQALFPKKDIADSGLSIAWMRIEGNSQFRHDFT